MTKKDLPSPELLRKLLRYEPDTGKLYWIDRMPEMFSDTDSRTALHKCNNWNAKYGGREALSCNDNGYRGGRIFRRYFKAHRVAWAIYYGEWPKNQIDHINGIRCDNRIKNLRDVTNQENSMNSSLPKDNTSGHIGVYWHSQCSKWNPKICVNGRSKSLGLYTNKDEAISARKKAEKRYGFFENHGKKGVKNERECS